MTACLTSADIERLVNNRLDPDERRSAEEHLSSCPLCRALCEAYRSMTSDGAGARAGAVTSDETEVLDPGAADETGRGEEPFLSIPGYRILEAVGEGGQGQVFRAVQTSMSRVVALKILRPRLTESASAIETFRREVELVAQLRHPGIVTVYDSGMLEGRRYYSMEFIAGAPLTEHLDQHRPDVRALLALFQSIAAAVGFAHKRGIVHRDLKPGNVRVDLESRPHILDFGLAKAMGPAGNGGEDITQTGEFKGTLAYASPEQTRGELKRVDARSDVYALGVMLYEALTGVRPHAEAANLSSMLASISEHTPIAPSKMRQGLDRDVDTIVMKALAKEPERRYKSAAELADDIGRYLEDLPLAARPVGLGYRVRRHVRRAAVRYPPVTMAVALLLACVGSVVAMWLVAVANYPDYLFESMVQPIVRYPHALGWPDDLQVVAMNDETYARVPHLAEALHLDGVRQDEITSWRMLHGALMERLAAARPAVVVWDIVFGAERPAYDAALVRGIEALHAVGSRVVFGAKAVDEHKRPLLTPPVARNMDAWGWVKIAVIHGMVRGTMLAINDPPEPPTPSLSVAAVCAFRHGDATPHYAWDLEGGTLLVSFAKEREDGAVDFQPDVMKIPTSDVEVEATVGAHRAEDVTRMRWAARTWIVIPSEEVMAAHTLAYHDVFDLDDEELAARFQGRIVLVGDDRVQTTNRPDRGLLDDGFGGREGAHCYVHASAIADRLQGVGARRPTYVTAILFVLLAGGLGVITGGRYAARSCWARFWITGVVLSALGVALAVGAVAVLGIIASPTSFLLAFWLAALGAGLALRPQH